MSGIFILIARVSESDNPFHTQNIEKYEENAILSRGIFYIEIMIMREIIIDRKGLYMIKFSGHRELSRKYYHIHSLSPWKYRNSSI